MTKIQKFVSKIELKYTKLCIPSISISTYLLYSSAFVDNIFSLKNLFSFSFLSKIFFFSLKNLFLFSQKSFSLR